MMKNIRKILKSEKGDSTYISTFIYIFIAAIMIAFILNVFQIISVKQQMDHCADQLVKQIQLNGGTNGTTASLFSFLAEDISGAENLSYTIETAGSASQIQIGTPFYVTVTGNCSLGGFWKLITSNLQIKAYGAGVSEHYWK